MKLSNLLLVLGMALSAISLANEVPGLTPVQLSVDRGRVMADFPISLPEIPMGVPPKLSISYSQGYSSSLLGRSFRLQGLDYIHRCQPTPENNQLRNDMSLALSPEASEFCMNGELLIETDDGYRKLTDDNTVFKSSGSEKNNPDRWIALLPDGREAIFDKDETGDSVNAHHNDRWLLKNIRKINSDSPELTAITYEYNDNNYNITPAKITYGDVVVFFNYDFLELTTPQVRQGKFLRAAMRLESIDVYREPGVVYSRYNLHYENINDNRDYRISGVSSCFENLNTCTRPSLVKYEDAESFEDYARDSSVIFKKGSSTSVEVPHLSGYTTGHIDNDGIVDFCTYSVDKELNGIVCGSRAEDFSRRNPSSEPVKDLSYIKEYYDKSGLHKSTLGAKQQKYSDDIQSLNSLTLLDLNNDGFDDYCYSDARNLWCGFNNQDGTFGDRFLALKSYPLQGEDQKFSTRYLDMNFDGFVDICFNKKHIRDDSKLYLHCRLNDGEGVWKNASQVSMLDEHEFKPFIKYPDSSSNTQVKENNGGLVRVSEYPAKFSTLFLDINADRITDYCVVNSKITCYLGSVENGKINYQDNDVININIYELIAGGSLYETAGKYSNASGQKDIKRALDTVTFGDINNDGSNDICFIFGSMPTCRLNNGIGGFSKEFKIEDVNAYENFSMNSGKYNENDMSRFYRSFEIKDWDRDGKNDLCWVNGASLMCSLATITSFTEAQEIIPLNLSEDVFVSLKSKKKKKKKSTLGYVKNGFKDGESSVRYYLSQDSAISFGPLKKINDTDGDGRPEICYRSEAGISCVNQARTSQHRIRTIENSYGAKKSVRYGSTLDYSVYVQSNKDTESIIRNPAIEVVSTLLIDNGQKNVAADFSSIGMNRTSFEYSDFSLNSFGKNVGFLTVKETAEASNLITNREYADNSRLVGELVKISVSEKINNDEQLISESSRTLEINQNKGYFLKRLTDQKNILWDQGTLYKTSEYSYKKFDEYNFPKLITTVTTGTANEDYSSVELDIRYEHKPKIHLYGLKSHEISTIKSKSSDETLRPAMVRTYDDYGRLRQKIKTVHENNSVNEDHEFALRTIYDDFTDRDQPQAIIKIGSADYNKGVWERGIRVKKIKYYANGLLQSETNALGHLTKYEYDSIGLRCHKATTITDANKRVHQLRYDAFCRENYKRSPDGSITTKVWEWDETLNRGLTDVEGLYTSTPSSYKTTTTTQLKSQVSSANIHQQAIEYRDRFGRILRNVIVGNHKLQSCKDGQQDIYTDYAYDKLGRQNGMTYPYGACDSSLDHINTQVWTATLYDNRGRKDKQIKPNEQGDEIRTYLYTGANAEESINNSVEQTITNSIHSSPLNVQKQGTTMSFKRNGLGLVTTVTRDNLVSNIQYDDFGQKIRMADPDMGTWTYLYNAFGELVHQVDGDKKETTLVYDKLGRLLHKVFEGDLWSWDYDPVNAIGDVKFTRTRNQVNRDFQYDDLGRIKSDTLTQGPASTGTTFKTEYKYDEANRLEETIHPSGVKVRRDYDYMGRLQRVSMPKASVSGYNLNAIDASIRYLQGAIDLLEKEVETNLNAAKTSAKEALRLQKHAENLASIDQEQFDILETLNKKAHSAYTSRKYYEGKMNAAQQQLDIMRKRGMDHFVAMKNRSPTNLYHAWDSRRKEKDGKHTNYYKDSDTVTLIDAYTREGQAARKRTNVTGQQCRRYFKRVVNLEKLDIQGRINALLEFTL